MSLVVQQARCYILTDETASLSSSNFDIWYHWLTLAYSHMLTEKANLKLINIGGETGFYRNQRMMRYQRRRTELGFVAGRIQLANGGYC